MANEFEAGTAYLQLTPSGKNFKSKAEGELSRINLDKKVDLDAEDSKLRAKVARAEATLDSLRRKKVDPQIDADIAVLKAKLTEATARLDELGKKKSTPAVEVQMERARADIVRFTAQLDQLNAKKADPRVDADITAAEANLRRAENELDRLARRSAQVRVDADTATADAKLRTTDRLADKVGRNSPKINVGIVGGSSVVSVLTAIVGVLALIASAAPIAVAALAAIPSAIAGGASALGAIKAGFSGVKDAIKAVESDQDKQSSSAASGAAKQVNAARQVESAQIALGQAYQQQSRTAIQGSQQVQAAVEALSAAQTQADRAAVTGAQQVAQARRALADAEVQAQRQVEDAERALGRAQQSERYALEALTDARKDATRALRDQRLETEGAALSQERAQINLQRAQQRLAEGVANGTSGLDMQELQLDVKDAEQSLKEVGNRYSDLKQDSAEASRAGVDGSKQVTSAMRALQAAQDNTADSARQLGRTQVDSAKSVQAAQEALAQAQQQAMWSQQDAARGVADAQRALSQAQQQAQWANADAAAQVAAAQRALQQAYQDAGKAGEDGATKSKTALDKLSPAGKHFVDFWVNEYKPKMREVSAAVAEQMLPKIESGLKRTEALIPTFKTGLSETGKVIGDLTDRGAEMISSGPWQADFATIMSSNNRALGSFGNAGLSLLDVIKNLAVAGGPFVEKLASATERGAGMLDNWIKLKASGGDLTRMFDDGWQRAKKFGDVIADSARAGGDLYDELKPLGDRLLDMLPTVIQIGSAFLGGFVHGMEILHPILDPIIKLVGQLAQGFSELPGPVQGAIFAFFLAPRVMGTAVKAIMGVVGATRTSAALLRALATGEWGQAFSMLAGKGRKAGEDAGSGLAGGLGSKRQALRTAGDDVAGAAVGAMDDDKHRKKADGAGRKMGGGLISGLKGLGYVLVATEIVDQISTKMDQYSQQVGGPKQAGHNIRKSFIDELTPMAPDAKQAGVDAFNALDDATRDGIVKVMIEAGKLPPQFGENLAPISPAAQELARTTWNNFNTQQRQGLSSALQDVGKFPQQMADGLGPLANVAAPPVIEARDKINGILIPSLPNTGQQAGQGIMQHLADSLKGLPGAVGPPAQGATDAARQGLGPMAPLAQQAGTQTQQGLLGPQGLGGLPGGTQQLMGQLPGITTGALSSLPGAAGNPATQAGAAFLQGIQVMPGHASDMGAESVRGMHQNLDPLAPGAGQRAQDTLHQFQQNLDPIQQAARDHGTGAVNGWNEGTKPLPDAGRAAGTNLGNAFTDAITSLVSKAIAWLATQIASASMSIRGLSGGAMLSRGPTLAPGPRGMAAGGLLRPMADGGTLWPIAYNDAGRSLSPMSGSRAEVVPPNTWRVIGDRMTGSELFAPLDGSKRTASLLAEAVAHEGFSMVERIRQPAAAAAPPSMPVAVASSAAASRPVVATAAAPAAAPAGPMRIVGTLDLGDGLEGRIEGVVDAQLGAVASAIDAGHLSD